MSMCSLFAVARGWIEVSPGAHSVAAWRPARVSFIKVVRPALEMQLVHDGSAAARVVVGIGRQPQTSNANRRLAATFEAASGQQPQSEVLLSPTRERQSG